MRLTIDPSGVASCPACSWQGVPTFLDHAAQDDCPACSRERDDPDDVRAVLRAGHRDMMALLTIAAPVLTPQRLQAMFGPAMPRTRVPRNQRCPCGSGLKAKKCPCEGFTV